MTDDAEIESLDDPEDLADTVDTGTFDTDTDDVDFDDTGFTDTTTDTTTDVDFDETETETGTVEGTGTDDELGTDELAAGGTGAMTGVSTREALDVDDAGYESGDINVVTSSKERGPSGSARAGDGRAAAGGAATSVAVLEYLARAMADDPDAVVVRQEQRRGSTVLRLHVSPQDMGRIIGRRGRTAQAIRTLVGAAGARDGVQTVVDIADT